MKLFTDCPLHGFTLFGECKKCKEKNTTDNSAQPYRVTVPTDQLSSLSYRTHPLNSYKPSESPKNKSSDDYSKDTDSLHDSIIWSSLTSDSYDSTNYDNGASSGGTDTPDNPSSDFGGYGGGDFSGGGSDGSW